MIYMISNFEKHLIAFLNTIKSIIIVLFFSKFKGYNHNKRSNKCIIFGNGPSLLNSLQSLSTKNEYDIFVTNDFARHHVFFNVKPNFYILIDPAFFRDENPDSIKKRALSIFENINCIDWKMNFLVPNKYLKKAKNKITNNNVIIKGFNHYPVNGYQNIMFKFYEKGLGMPKAQNVLISCLIIAINNHYNEIEIYGAEHNWCRFMVLNDKNELCLESHHFYSNDKTIKPWYKSNKEILKVSEALEAMALMFRGYEKIRKFADYKGVKIINKTPNTLIDSFERNS